MTAWFTRSSPKQTVDPFHQLLQVLLLYKVAEVDCIVGLIYLIWGGEGKTKFIQPNEGIQQ